MITQNNAISLLGLKKCCWKSVSFHEGTDMILTLRVHHTRCWLFLWHEIPSNECGSPLMTSNKLACIMWEYESSTRFEKFHGTAQKGNKLKKKQKKTTTAKIHTFATVNFLITENTFVQHALWLKLYFTLNPIYICVSIDFLQYILFLVVSFKVRCFSFEGLFLNGFMITNIKPDIFYIFTLYIGWLGVIELKLAIGNQTYQQTVRFNQHHDHSCFNNGWYSINIWKPFLIVR